MSFSSDTKKELCALRIGKKCCASSELYGAFLFSNTFSPGLLKINTESGQFSERMRALLKFRLGVDFDGAARSEKGKYTLLLSDAGKLSSVAALFGLDARSGPALHLNAAVVEDGCCREAFLRGAFLAGGSVTNPETKYHLELVTRHYSVSRELRTLLLDMDFTPKETLRKSKYVLYFKDSESIEDFLTRVGAPASALKIMEVKVEKDLKNTVNRKVNFETANISKTVDAAQLQLEAIRRLRDTEGLDSLTPALRQAAELRIDNEDASLSELCELHSPKLSRSGLNHRLRKLIELSGIEERKND